MAALAVACRHGFELPDALAVARDTYVDVNIHADENSDRLQSLASLPDSCTASADCLEDQREVYERYGIFAPSLINATIRHLRSWQDSDLRESLNTPQAVQELVTRFFHCG